jgi:hypothetical protein
MKRANCEHCSSTDLPLNDTLKINDKTTCPPCYDTHFKDHADLKSMTVIAGIDPTVCFSCGTDNGELELPRISVHPVCAGCLEDIRNRTFPKWVKGFFIALLVIVVFSFWWNSRFYTGYRQMKLANAAFASGEFDHAAVFAAEAGEHMPEVAGIGYMRAFYNGVSLLQNDNPTEALEEFNRCKDFLTDDYRVNELMTQAKIGAGFDTRNYALFLEGAGENLEADSTLANSWATVASAYACLYAQNGDEESKQHALHHLDKARMIDSTDIELTDYYNFIEHRLYTREILRREDFTQRYPGGWTHP